MTLPPGIDGISGKESACQCRRHKRCEFDPCVVNIPLHRKWQSTPVFLPGKFCGQRSLAGYVLWNHKESDISLSLSLSLTHTHTHTHTHSTAEESKKFRKIFILWVGRQFILRLPFWHWRRHSVTKTDKI